jgi:hypothetical protein
MRQAPLNSTQERVYAVLSETEQKPPMKIAVEAGMAGNAGGAAASLKVLVKMGLALKHRIGKRRGFVLWGYTKNPERDTVPSPQHAEGGE